MKQWSTLWHCPFVFNLLRSDFILYSKIKSRVIALFRHFLILEPFSFSKTVDNLLRPKWILSFNKFWYFLRITDRFWECTPLLERATLASCVPVFLLGHFPTSKCEI